jgi:pyruvate-formate lyase-activating enzyme
MTTKSMRAPKGLPVWEESAERRRALAAAWERLDPRFRLPNQVLGRRSAIGCVALEITQRCNLDCTLCYLSLSSESVKDVPLEILFDRIDRIRATYGPGISVQVTGGDPTLRKRDELVAIVRRVSERGLRPSLFTNGIKATRDLLEELAEAGLFDVAFHVDTTQRFKRYPTEEALNAIRREYIERARGLKLAVIFNTSVHGGNLEEIPALVRFFIENSDVVGMASFQVQARTGRGELRHRDAAVGMAGIRDRITRGVGEGPLAWDAALLGHPDCHKAAMLATVGGRAVDVLSSQALYERFLDELKDVPFDRRDVRATARRVLGALLKTPYWATRGGIFLLRKLWPVRRELVAARGKTGKITFFIQNFMDADSLDPERVANCSFMVMTDDGPVSMCAHNARRDDYILKPLGDSRAVKGVGGKMTMFPPSLTVAGAPLLRSRAEPAAR